MTLTQALTQFGYLKRDVTDVSDELWIYWGDMIQQEFRRTMEGVDPERYISTQSYTVSSSPSSQALPTDFRDISTLHCGIFYLNDDLTPRGDQLAQTFYGANTAGFYISGSNIYFTGINSPTAFLARYMPTVAQITSMSDEFDIPDEYSRYVMDAYDELYSQWDDDQSSESAAGFRLSRSLSNLTKTIPRQPTVYALRPHN